MENHAAAMGEALQRLAQNHHLKVYYLDVAADELIGVSFQDSGSDEGKEVQKASDAFEAFCNGPLCHPGDRQRLKDFISFSRLQESCQNVGHGSQSFVYRRKLEASEQTYSTFSMEVFPRETESGTLAAYIFIRNITPEIQEYDRSLEESEKLLNFVPGKRKVLIIEDNDINRELLAEILSDDYQVLQAENGAAGLEILQEHLTSVSLVILDVQMPVMNGYEFLKYVKSDPFLSKIPIVVATGNNDESEEEKCLRLGAEVFVGKPYKAEIIKSRVAGLIRLRESVATMSMLQTDDRTGLYNLQAFYYHTKRVIDKAPEKAYSIIIFDINHFKTINETYGEATGDFILQQIAQAVNKYTAASDINGRFGAARFLLLTESMSHEDTDIWIKKLFASLKSVCNIKMISFKAGIYENIDRSISIATACERAITALNSVGRNYENSYAYYDEKQAQKMHRLTVLESDMREAYEKEQFSVYYQPKHDVNTGKLVGAEALIRWIHPEFGFLSPGEFIPLFEKNGFVSYADYYVLRRTCRNLKSWREEGIATVPISINASRRDFEQNNFLSIIKRPVQEYQIDPSLIHVEVTETLFSEHLEELSQTVQECRDAGFLVELDDFGSGYSSLNTLASLPLDVMKLDMSFMKNINNEKKMKVLSTCINLAKSLGLKTVQEGAETAEQIELLKKLGVDWIQGYYFSKPIPEDEFRDYLIKYSK